jgi:hypothetical protein
VYESYQRHPVVVTSSEISKRLGITYKSALLLKRRFQLFCSDQSEKVRALFNHELKEKFNGFNFPIKRDTDLTPYLKVAGDPEQKTPVNIDTMALFSASQRANKGRARHRHGGCTASIFLSDTLGGKQVGSLYQTICWKKGPIILKSLPTQRAEHLRPILNGYIPHRIPVFSDEGYKWYVNPNHRTINHSAKSKDKRYRWARNRWSKLGVNVQAAEGQQGSFKTAMRTYRYFKPEYSQLYAEEWTFMKNIKYFGFEALLGTTADKINAGPLSTDTYIEESKKKAGSKVSKNKAGNKVRGSYKAGKKGSGNCSPEAGNISSVSGCVGIVNKQFEPRFKVKTPLLTFST